jgi:hypothetical protein
MNADEQDDRFFALCTSLALTPSRVGNAHQNHDKVGIALIFLWLRYRKGYTKQIGLVYDFGLLQEV